MRPYDVIRAALSDAGITQAQAARSIGRNASYINSSAARGSDPSTGNAAALLAAAGYTLAAIPTELLPPGVMVFDATPPRPERLAARKQRLEEEADALDELLATLDGDIQG